MNADNTLMNEKSRGYEVIYVESLDRKEKQAYLIAKSHLGDSFSLKKSLGFLNWTKNQKLAEGLAEGLAEVGEKK
jgi:hypothetical protein